ncbi:MAG: oligosaccharide flippase family protein, partial [Inhella sp.]
SIRKALAFSFIDRYASLLVGIVSSMLLSRLLTPKEIGVFSVVMVLLSFAATIRDLGAGQYLLQERDLTRDRIRAVWAVQLGVGALLALVAALAAGFVARWFDEPRMRDIMLVMALGFLVNPFGSITYAWLMRSMRYDALAVMRFSGNIAGALTSVSLAWAGWGPISLAIGAIVTSLVNALVAVRFRPPDYPWLPGLREIRRVLSFGTKVSSSTLIQTATTGMPELLLGKLQGLTQVGLYSRANGLIQMFARLVADAVNTVALSMFAKASREQGGFAAPFLKANAYMTALAWSFFLLVGLLADPIVLFLYGGQWGDSVPLVRGLAVLAAVAAPAALCYEALLAAGAASQLLRTMMVSGALLIGGSAVGAWFSTEAMIGGLLAATTVSSCLWLRIARQQLQFEWRPYLNTLGRSAAVALASSIGPALLVCWLGWAPALTVFERIGLIAIAGLSCAAGFLLAAGWLRHPISSEFERVRDKLFQTK